MIKASILCALFSCLAPKAFAFHFPCASVHSATTTVSPQCYHRSLPNRAACLWQAYNAALGLYQPATAYMLILASQKDPAEHLHELHTFNSIANEHMRCFAIDCKLGRHSSALKHIVAAGVERATEARAFARKHGLLRSLLQLLQGQLELRAAAMLEVGRVRAVPV